MADSETTNRRGFLLGAGLGAAAAMALPVTPLATSAPADAAPQASPGGYRASPHVLKYYKTTET